MSDSELHDANNARSRSSRLAVGAFTLAATGLVMTVAFPADLILTPAALLVAFLALAVGITALARRPRRKRLAIAAVVIAAGALAVQAPRFGDARPEARRIISRANMLRIGEMLDGYAADHQERFPSDLESLLARYRVDPSILYIPGSEPRQQSYYYIPKFRRDHITTVLLYENPASGGGGGHVYYSDGYIAWIPRRAYREVFAQLERERDEAMRSPR